MSKYALKFSVLSCMLFPLLACASETWISVLPAQQDVRLVTDALWSTAAGSTPTLLTQHRWVRFPGKISISAIRIEPLPGTDNADQDRGNRPRRIIVQTSADFGTSFKTIADINLSDWKDASPALCRFKTARIDNLRLVIPDAARMRFPIYPNAKKIEILASSPLPAQGDSPVFSPKPTVFTEPLPANYAAPSGRVIISQAPDTIAFRTPCMRLEFAKTSPRITFLGWDIFNNTSNFNNNLLCTYGPAGVLPCISGSAPNTAAAANDYYKTDSAQDPLVADSFLVAGSGGTASLIDKSITYRDITLGENIKCDLTFDILETGFDVAVNWRCSKKHNVLQAAALRIPFDLQSCVTNVIAMPDTAGPLGLARFPLLINNPDNGQMRVTADSDSLVYAAVHTSRPRSQLWLDLILGARPLPSGMLQLTEGKYTARFHFRLANVFPYCKAPYGDFRFRPLLSVPEVDPMRSGLLRGWISGLAFRPDIGVFANNSVSDSALYCQRFYFEHALYTPRLAPGLDVSDLMRFTLEQIFADAPFWGMDLHNFPSNAGSVVSSLWCYLAKTGDWSWARRNKLQIEKWTLALAKNHTAPDGLMRETTAGTGTAGAGKSWWDAMSSGGVEAFNNAHAYRELLRGAELMDRLDNPELASQLRDCASRLKANYSSMLYNPATGWIADWRDVNGVIHDFGNIASTSSAIACGVIEPSEGKPMLAAILAKLRDIGFTRFEFGVPQHMIPVPRDFFCFGYGASLELDGLETSGLYMNGGIAPGQEYYFLQALYLCSMRTQANEILAKLCEGYYSGKISGPLNSGLDWKRSDGRPTGYEGLLTDMYHPLQAVLTGYLGIDYTLDGPNCPPGSSAAWLIEKRKSSPDFGPAGNTKE